MCNGYSFDRCEHTMTFQHDLMTPCVDCNQVVAEPIELHQVLEMRICHKAPLLAVLNSSCCGLPPDVGVYKQYLKAAHQRSFPRRDVVTNCLILGQFEARLDLAFYRKSRGVSASVVARAIGQHFSDPLMT